MRRSLQLVLLTVAIATVAFSGEILDRVVAIVNNTPIFQSDWELALRSEALMNGRTPESFTDTEQQAVFGRLVDQELLHEQMRGFMIEPVKEEEVESRLREVRNQIAPNESDNAWHQLLAQAGLTETELKVRIRLQLETLRFIDTRFRPTVRVDFRTIQQYYRNEFLPELQKRSGQNVPLSEVSAKIREILTQRRIDEQVTAWLQTLRDQADIRIPRAQANREPVQSK